MNLELNNKIALVTGASSGIGAATAKILAQEGADVAVCCGGNIKGAQQTVSKIRALGQRAWLFSMDIGNPQQVSATFERVKTEIGSFDILVLCAGKNTVTPLENISVGEWNEIININLNGPFFAIQAALPLLRKKATIITVASVAAHTGAPHHAHYAAAKAGLINLTKSIARALGPDVRVNCVSPGITLTSMGQETVEHLPADYAEKKLLLNRYATPEEIARCVVFLASPAASFVTGATLDVNGGRDLR